MLNRLEYMHARNFIHRDIKPDNFLIHKLPSNKMLFIIDFGLSKRYRDSKTDKHIEYRDGKSLTGTARYASVNSHVGVEQARRDDLESIGYVLLYFLRGNLPWQGLQGPDKHDKYKRIKECKIATPVDILIRGFPHQLAEYVNYSKSLRFEEEPNITYLKGIFESIIETENMIND
jgi:serine/threonine protein kinase